MTPYLSIPHIARPFPLSSLIPIINNQKKIYAWVIKSTQLPGRDFFSSFSCQPSDDDYEGNERMFMQKPKITRHNPKCMCKCMYPCVCT